MAKAPRGERLIIAITGKRNAGKSSLINALTGQEIAIVSEIAGTTTDPVDKHYELLPLGPVTFYDTAGIDDVGELGLKRIMSTRKVLYRADVAILVVSTPEIDSIERNLVKEIQELRIPLLIVFNKSDLVLPSEQAISFCTENEIKYSIVSSATGKGVKECKDVLMSLAPELLLKQKPLVSDLVPEGSHVVLVTPIDVGAPKGRMILPQMQVLRDLLDYGNLSTVVREFELKQALQSLKSPPALVVTDSQAIKFVSEIVPDEVMLTTFSILFARYKGELLPLLEGARKLDSLQDGDKVLIAESCSHHVQCDDIGRVKMPRWLKQYTGKELVYKVFAGHDFPDDLESYKVAIHCGACMINPQEMHHRILECQRRGIPITNYGMAISKMEGDLERVIRVFNL
jgi:[FeFe] hydrogenase H-cluster maturation GTPase HydF